MFIYFYFFLRDREREGMSREGAEREGNTESKACSRLWAGSTEPDVGLEPMSCEIMIWAEVRCLADWATQVTLEGFQWDSTIHLKTTTVFLLFLVYFRIKAPNLPQGKLFFWNLQLLPPLYPYSERIRNLLTMSNLLSSVALFSSRGGSSWVIYTFGEGMASTEFSILLSEWKQNKTGGLQMKGWNLQRFFHSA